jgi:hypothetical protein
MNLWFRRVWLQLDGKEQPPRVGHFDPSPAQAGLHLVRYFWVHQPLDLDRQSLDIYLKGDNAQALQQNGTLPGHFLNATLFPLAIQPPIEQCVPHASKDTLQVSLFC